MATQHVGVRPVFDFQLKRAQVALADGRLDEAFELLKDPSLRSHRSGQKLLTRLSGAFVQRGQDHLSANRLAPALEDCLRAEKLVGNVSDVVRLREVIAQQIESERAESQQRAEQLARAKEQMQNGWLSTGRKILAQTDDRQAQCLLQNAELLEVEKESAAKRIEQALKNRQIELAAQIFQNSALRGSMNHEAVSLLERIQQQAHRKVHDYLLEGQIHLAAAFLNQLNGLISRCEMIQPFRQAVEYSRQAVTQIDTGNFESAAVCLRKIRTLLPKAKWLMEMIGQAQTAAAAQQKLQAGPLGILESIALSKVSESYETAKKAAQPIPAVNGVPFIGRHNGMDMKTRFILQMDGIGAFHVLCGNRNTIGPVSGSKRSDIELVTAPDVRPKQIERIDSDYFFGGDQSGSGKRLLSDGDRIELSPRCRFKFTLPNPASSTACLIPSSGRFPRADISGVILMDREILIGPERNNHVQSGLIAEAITLFLQDGQIRCRSNQLVYAGGSALGSDQTLPMDTQIEAGDFRFILTTHNN
jgi:hypothetical protein